MPGTRQVHTQGTIQEILVSPASAAPMQSIQEALLVAGRGIEGDRYANDQGTFSPKLKGKPDKEVTLIESEEIEAFNAQTLFGYPNGAFRRNLVTRGIRLNDLSGKEFTIGSVRLRGIRLCEPCATLAGQLGQEVLQHMVHKCGLRAEVLQGGAIHTGDKVAAVSS
jgi:MOSC domain-containing protein YiiM